MYILYSIYDDYIGLVKVAVSEPLVDVVDRNQVVASSCLIKVTKQKWCCECDRWCSEGGCEGRGLF